MRGFWWLAIVLVAGGCSCDRRPDAQDQPDVRSASQADAAPADPEPALQAAPSVPAGVPANSVSASVSTLHAYVAAVAGKDWIKADAHWTGGKAPPRPDDFALRGIEDLRSMRINNESPIPLDRESPARSVEIPVTLRIRKDTGAYEIRGWYRLRRKIGGDGWEITSASLQPAIG